MQEPSIDRPDVAPTVDQLAARIGRDQVFGPPVEQAGAVVAPVARVRGGGGWAGCQDTRRLGRWLRRKVVGHVPTRLRP